MEIGNGTFLHGDCLELMAGLPDGSVDMVLCDLPYGTTACSWDSIIPFESLWEQYWRVCKQSAAIVLTASQPFTTALIASQMDKFKYCWVWEKSRAVNPSLAKKQPLRAHEDVCVFYSKAPTYNPQMEQGERYSTRANDTSVMGGRKVGDGAQNREIEIRSERYPRSVLKIKSGRQQDSLHPTQKPVALFEYLIRTYTNEGETVLDNTAGSGTTAIAAENAGRRWICMERDPDYYASALGRVWDHVNAA